MQAVRERATKDENVRVATTETQNPLLLQRWRALVAAENADAMILAKGDAPITEMKSTTTDKNDDDETSTTLVETERQPLAQSNDEKTPISKAPMIATRVRATTKIRPL